VQACAAVSVPCEVLERLVEPDAASFDRFEESDLGVASGVNESSDAAAAAAVQTALMIVIDDDISTAARQRRQLFTAVIASRCKDELERLLAIEVMALDDAHVGLSAFAAHSPVQITDVRSGASGEA
jgi:hypothetical protein